MFLRVCLKCAAAMQTRRIIIAQFVAQINSGAGIVFVALVNFLL